MNETKISVSKEKISRFCEKYHILRFSFFGSVLSDHFSPESDIDILVEFAPEHIPGLSFFSIQDELSQLFGRKVDLNTPNFLSPYFREEVQKMAEVQYERL